MIRMQEELSFIKSKRKYLFCADKKGADALFHLIKQVMAENVPFDFHLLDDEPTTQSELFLTLWFNQQKMGTYLYLSGRWEMTDEVKKLAIKLGFSEQEMQINVWGASKKNLLCCKCHGINEIDDLVQITCLHCGLELSVSDHYSRRLDAYLGYVAKL